MKTKKLGGVADQFSMGGAAFDCFAADGFKGGINGAGRMIMIWREVD